MKKLGILFIVFALAFVSCNEEDSISKRDREAAKRENALPPIMEQRVEPQPSTVYYEPAPLSDDGNSYWFVVVKTKDGTTQYNNVLKQNHRWFSVKEAKEGFSNKDVFILSVTQVSRETYEELL